MSKRYKQPIHRDTEARTRSGLLSLFWMFVGAVIAVMVGVFLYMSPLFDGFRKEVEVNPPADVKPLPQTPTKNEYEFYEILPNREFKGGNAGLGEQKSTEATPTPQEDTPAETIPQESDGNIEIVEENSTYDDTSDGVKTTITLANKYMVKVKEMNAGDDVDKLVVDLMVLGVNVKVINKSDQDGDFVEIVTEPLSKERAYEINGVLRKNGVKAIVVEDSPQ